MWSRIWRCRDGIVLRDVEMIPQRLAYYQRID